MSIIAWEEPPEQAQGPGGGRWSPLRAELLANEGKWALVVNESTQDAPKVVARIRSLFPLRKGYVIRVQNMADLPLKLWIKYDPAEAETRMKSYKDKTK